MKTEVIFITDILGLTPKELTSRITDKVREILISYPDLDEEDILICYEEIYDDSIPVPTLVATFERPMTDEEKIVRRGELESQILMAKKELDKILL